MITELQGKYLANKLNDEEVTLFLNYLRENEDAPFRLERIKKLEQQIAAKEKRDAAKKELEQIQRNAAIEYSNLTKKWEESGAHWKCIEKRLTKWYYHDQCFFSWFSGMDAVEHLNAAKKSDVEFDLLVSETRRREENESSYNRF